MSIPWSGAYAASHGWSPAAIGLLGLGLISGIVSGIATLVGIVNLLPTTDSEEVTVD